MRDGGAVKTVDIVALRVLGSRLDFALIEAMVDLPGGCDLCPAGTVGITFPL